jgi:hypothetical protein
MDEMAALFSDKRLAAVALGILFAGCGGMSASSKAAEANRVFTHFVKHHTAGLGPVLRDAFGGEIFGWDIDQNGSDGVLSETANESQPPYLLNAIETFDEVSGKITKVVQKTRTESNGPVPVVDAIAGNDVGLIDDEYDYVQNGQIVRDDKFLEMNPVSGNKITGSWKPPHSLNLLPNLVTNNQASSSQVMMAYDLNNQGFDVPRLYMYDVARNIWGKPYVWPPKNQAVISGLPDGYLLYAAVDTKINVALIGFQLSYSESGPTWFDVFDVDSGKLLHTFLGLGNGFVNGMAIDSTTGIMCTTDESMSVVFTDVSTGKGFTVQIPILYGGGPDTGGAAVAVDPIHHLFLIAQLNSTFSPNGGSTVIVYDEQGNIVEAINGFSFLDRFSVVVVHIAVNPAGRIGYVPGANQGQLQSFTY